MLEMFDSHSLALSLADPHRASSLCVFMTRLWPSLLTLLTCRAAAFWHIFTIKPIFKVETHNLESTEL